MDSSQRGGGRHRDDCGPHAQPLLDQAQGREHVEQHPGSNRQVVPAFGAQAGEHLAGGLDHATGFALDERKTSAEWNRLERQALGIQDRVFVMGQHVKPAMQASYGIAPEKIAVPLMLNRTFGQLLNALTVTTPDRFQ